ncbi:MAG: undecaprenyldiphospho-muramoylpentapeptide beta-N-acetylglucosaminyltransferase [Spirochaetaceae bacterium]|nr:undecaprenyldiphospho-muramoylpentapeptide beta-N-acetylglucosaminyltransferase [Spirochaetaceae bacterium]
MNKDCLGFTGGGTGGHVYPAKPLIDQLLKENPQREIHWIGSSDGMEKGLIIHWPVIFKGISSGKLRRYFSLRNFNDPLKILWGFFQARRYLKKIRPKFLFSKGGFVSVPPVWAARSLKIPVFSHDSDMDPGLATKLNASTSKAIFVPYEESLKYYTKWKNKVWMTGNPVREEFFSATTQQALEWLNYPGEKPILLVLGGSSGAKAINDLVIKNLDLLCDKFFVVHQMGQENFMESHREDYRSFAYINEELPSLMKASSLAISRAGAASLWELAVSRTPMILIPLNIGSRGDQIRNAELFEKKGWARVLDQENLTSGELTDTVEIMGPLGAGGRSAMDSMEKNPPLRAQDKMLKIIGEVL